MEVIKIHELFETLRIVEEAGHWRPRVVVWENVAGVLDSDMRGAFVDYLNKMTELGYTNSYQKINAMDHGIPQKKRKAIRGIYVMRKEV